MKFMTRNRVDRTKLIFDRRKELIEEGASLLTKENCNMYPQADHVILHHISNVNRVLALVYHTRSQYFDKKNQQDIEHGSENLVVSKRISRVLSITLKGP